jgi:hypothetical protein
MTPVDIPTMADLYDGDKEPGFLNLIDDPINTQADSPELKISCKFDRSRRMRVLRK